MLLSSRIFYEFISAYTHLAAHEVLAFKLVASGIITTQ